jgi:hypothetical protein
MRSIRLLLLTLAFTALLLDSRPTASVPIVQNRVDPDDGSPNQYGACDGFVGGGNCARESNGIQFGTQCDDSGCTAWTNCPNGPPATCHGDYRGQADESGVGCKNSGGDIWNPDYCH